MLLFHTDVQFTFTPSLIAMHTRALQRASIEAALQANFLFDNVTQVQHDILLDAFQNMKVSAGDYVIKEGDRGNCFYIIDTGVFEVYIYMCVYLDMSTFHEPTHSSSSSFAF